MNYLRILVGLTALVLGIFGNRVIKADDDSTDFYIQSCVKKEIDQQLQKRSKHAKKHMVKMKHDIQSSVSREVKRQVKEHEWDERGKEAYRSRRSAGKDGYALPAWPTYSQFYYKPDFFQFTFQFDTASESYSSHGHSQDVSQLIFNKKNITVKDILVTSKLMQAGKLKSSSPLDTGTSFIVSKSSDTKNINTPQAHKEFIQANHYLSFLADEPVIFDGEQSFYRGTLHFARHYWDGDVSAGITIPVAVKHTSLRIKGDVSQANKEKIANLENGLTVDGKKFNSDSLSTNLKEANFLQFNRMYSSFEDFIDQILDAKNINRIRNTTTLELGDMDLYVNLRIHSKYYERGLVGARLVLPTAQRTDPFTLFDPALGNDGTTQIGFFGSFLWERWWFFNPYVHGLVTYSFPKRMRERVPTIVKQGMDGRPTNLLFGQNVFYTSEKFTELDTAVRGLADTTSRVKVNPGPEFKCMLGNIFQHECCKNGFFEVYYDLWVKFKDYHTKFFTDPANKRELCTLECGDTACNLDDNTWRISHTIGGDFNYQFNDTYRLRGGIFYVVAGRNVPKTLGVNFSLNVEF